MRGLFQNFFFEKSFSTVGRARRPRANARRPRSIRGPRTDTKELSFVTSTHPPLRAQQPHIDPAVETSDWVVRTVYSVRSIIR